MRIAHAAPRASGQEFRHCNSACLSGDHRQQACIPRKDRREMARPEEIRAPRGITPSQASLQDACHRNWSLPAPG